MSPRNHQPTFIAASLFVALASITTWLLGPAFIRARERTNAQTCMGNLRRVNSATRMYLADFDETFPFAWGMPGVGPWYTAISPFLGLKRDPTGKADWPSLAPVFHCPADTDAPSRVSYATNALIDGCGSDQAPERSEIYSSILRPELVVWVSDTNKLWTRKDGFYDTITDWIRPLNDLGYPKTDDRAVAFYRKWLKERDWTDLHATAFDCPDGLYRCKYPSFRHGRKGPKSGSANFLFVDGHVKAVRWGVLNIINFFPAPSEKQLKLYNQ